MKKILCSMLLVVLMLLGAANCLAAEEETYLIYRNNDFEDHKVGETPRPFAWHYYDGYGFYSQEEARVTAVENTEIVTIEKDGNTSNKAVKFNADTDDPKYDVSVRNHESSARAIFTYYPMKKNGVISFSFRAEDATKEKAVTMMTNAVTSKIVNHGEYLDSAGDLNNTYGRIFTIKNGKLTYTGNGTVEIGNVANNTWYDIDFVVDIPAGTGTVYFNGTSKAVALPANTVNISEVRFFLPRTAGDVWYIDDVRIYEADEVLADSVLDAQWESYKDSSFYVGYEFEGSRAANYDYMAFLKCDGKRFSILNTNRVFDGSIVQTLPTKIHKKDDMIMVPIMGMSEVLGATTSKDASTGVITVDYNGKVIEFTSGSDTYYVNGKPAKLLYAIEDADDVACIQIDVLFGLLEKTYSLDGEILWIDQPNEFNWHMPTDSNGNEIGGTSNYTLADNIYKRILHMLLYDRPTAADITATMKTIHPRVEFTAESVATIKANLATDSELRSFVKARLEAADAQLKAPQTDADGNQLYYPNGEPKYVDDVVYGTGEDGKRISFGGVGDYVDNLAFGYLFTDDAEKKAQYKARILHHLAYTGDKTLFPDWGINYNSGLGTGTMAYGFAHAIDWVDWTDEELEMIEEICRRNVLDHALHSYTCTLNQFHHSFSYSEGNMALIINGGILSLAVSLYENDPDYYGVIIRGAIRASEGGTIAYFPNGEYIEGISYWRYASGHLANLLKTLDTSMNTTWGIEDVPGVLKTAYFPFMMKGATEAHAYAFGDGQAEKADSPLMMYVADKTGDKALAQFRKTHQQSAGKTAIDIANWVFDTEGYSQIYDADTYNAENSTVIMKNGTELSDTSVAFHGGANNDGHGHWDIGSFQFDMSGVRFAMDLERENYNLRDKGHTNINKVEVNYPKDKFPEGYPYSGGHYYRQKGEGHNTVVANRSVINAKKLYDENGVFTYPGMTGTYDMVGSAKSWFTEMKLGDDVSYAMLNMTETNNIFDCAIRGVKLDKVNNILYVQDDFKAKTETDFLWSMHTKATTFSVSADGKTAVLTSSGGTKIKATIINDNGSDFKFEVLPAEFDTTYGSDVKPRVETPNTDLYKLAVRTPVGENITRFKLAVAFQPYDSTATPEYIPMETWKNN